MSPQLTFTGAAKGQTPEAATVSSAIVMGKAIAPEDLAQGFGNAVTASVMTPVNILANSTSVITTVVAPGGGLEAKGNEQPYIYKGADMFGLDKASP